MSSRSSRTQNNPKQPAVAGAACIGGGEPRKNDRGENRPRKSLPVSEVSGRNSSPPRGSQEAFFFGKCLEKPVLAGFPPVVSGTCVQQCFGESPMSVTGVDRDPDEFSRKSARKKVCRLSRYGSPDDRTLKKRSRSQSIFWLLSGNYNASKHNQHDRIRLNGLLLLLLF